MKKFLAAIVVFVISLASVGAPVMAAGPVGIFGDDARPMTNILRGCEPTNGEDSGGSGIVCILKLGVEILSIGVGILGVIGISVSGIQYLTAGGSEEKTRKAKRRIFEIVIGLAAYAVIYALLQWLLPGFQIG